jgi:hypothetical protein
MAKLIERSVSPWGSQTSARVWRVHAKARATGTQPGLAAMSGLDCPCHAALARISTGFPVQFLAVHPALKKAQKSRRITGLCRRLKLAR